MSDSAKPERPAGGGRDYERTLGVIESFAVVRDQCPSGAVRAVAVSAIEATRQGDPAALREQAYFVLTAIKGWRGPRAAQVHRSLSAFLEPGSALEPGKK